MDIEILKEFLTLTKELNFSRTANIHFLVQPVLSKHIQQLEETVGVQLFHRTKQQVELTREGKLFRDDANRIVSAWEESLQKLANARREYHSTLLIAFLDAASRNLLPGFLQKFMELYPSVSLDLENSSIPQTYILMEERKCDLALTIQAKTGNFQTYDTLQLYRDRLCIIAPNTHWLAGMEEVSIKDLMTNTI